jgi:hypothetical protein
MNPNQSAPPSSPTPPPGSGGQLPNWSQQPQGQPQPFQPGQQNPQGGESPQYVFMARPMEPQKLEISEETMKKHLASNKKFPFLNLSEGEYVIDAISRHPIGMVGIWAAVIFVIGALVVVMMALRGDTFTTTLGSMGGGPSLGILMIPFLLLTLLALIIGFVASYVYSANKFYLTNESVIQHIQLSLFSRHEQTVSLINVEDASYQQHGIIQYIFGYGTLRLSTEGEETTYRFTFAPNPKPHIAVLNNAVEAFKNGRPVTAESYHSDF